MGYFYDEELSASPGPYWNLCLPPSSDLPAGCIGHPARYMLTMFYVHTMYVSLSPSDGCL